MSRKRLSGFIVGRKTVQQTPGWKIAVRSSAGRRSYFAPEANFAEGMEVVPGQEVEFSTQKVEGRWRAFEISPLTAQMEERTMRKIRRDFIAFAAFVIILTCLGATGFQPTHWQPFRNWVVTNKANNMLAQVKQLAADQIISDDVVRAAVRGTDEATLYGQLHEASWAAREEVFSRYMDPIFSTGYDDPSKACKAVRYVDQMQMDPDGYGKYYYQEAGVPATIAPQAKDIRTKIYDICRSYLKVPDNLQTIYTAKKAVAIDEFKQLPPNHQDDFRHLVAAIAVSFIQFRDNDSLRNDYLKYLKLQEKITNKEHRTSAYLSIFKEQQEMNRLGTELQDKIYDTQLYQFVGRRYLEGGKPLLSSYIKCLTDLQFTLLDSTQ